MICENNSTFIYCLGTVFVTFVLESYHLWKDFNNSHWYQDVLNSFAFMGIVIFSR